MGDSHGWTSALCAADLQIKFTVHSPGRGMGRGRGGVGLSQSRSLLISGSGSWLQLAFAAENIKNVPLALRVREKL